MDAEEIGRILAGLVRVGTVTNVDEEKRMARVKFQSENMTSGWLHVLAARPYIPNYDEPQWTEFDSEWKGERTGDPDYTDHRHKLMIKPWLPMVNATVLCVYLPVFNADGFILGEIGGAGEIKQ